MTDSINKPRMTMRDVVRSIAEVFNLDRGIILTLHDLVVRPRRFFQTYFFEDRNKYTHPTTLLLLMLAGVVLSSRHLLPVSDSYSPNLLLTVTATNDHELNVLQLLKEYDDAVRLLLVPITSSLSYSLFRKQAWYFAEHLAFNAYILAFQFFLMIIFLPLTIKGLDWIVGISSLLYFIFVYVSCMNGSRVFTAAKSLFVILGSNLLFAGLLYPFTLWSKLG